MDTNSDTLSNAALDAVLLRTIMGVADEKSSADIGQSEADEGDRTIDCTASQDLEGVFANTITATLLDVAARHALTDGVASFSVEKVVDESMSKLERLVGAPSDRQAAKTAVFEYIDEVHLQSVR